MYKLYSQKTLFNREIKYNFFKEIRSSKNKFEKLDIKFIVGQTKIYNV
jgi:hypothetical protein